MKRISLATLLWILVNRLVGADVCAAPGFIAPDRYALPGVSAAIVTGDFNNDGIPDVATLAQDDANGITVLIGKPDGTFEDAVSSGGPGAANLIVTGYFDADDNLDIVTASYFSAVRLYRGNGDGTFQPPVEISNSSVNSALTAADVDGDGNTDVIFVDSTAGDVKILLGRGDGTFADPLVVDDSGNSITFARVDAGESLDLILAHGNPAGVTIYPGNGDGTFGTPISLTAPGGVFSSVQAADLNGDGKMDVMVVNGYFVTVFLGHGDGSFDPALNSSAGTIPWQLTLADFNGDGVPDAVVSERDTFGGGQFGYPYLLILIGNGDGTFRTGRSYATAGAALIATADFGNLGRVGLATVSADPAVSIFAGYGDGTFRGILTLSNGTFFAAQVATGDFDGDGRSDVAHLENYQSIIFVELLNTDLTLREIFEYPIPASQTLSSADFDGDGRLDLLTIRRDTHELLFFRGNGDGSFASPVPSPGPDAPEIEDVTIGDFDGDGHPDVAIATQNAYHNLGAIWIRLGNGDGTFRAAGSIPLFQPPTRLLAADFDPDGLADLAVVGGVSIDSGVLLTLRSLGDGTFEAIASYDIDPSPTAIVAGDFVEDGIVDLAIQAGRTTILQGFGGGGFSPVSHVDVADSLLSEADFNGDGHRDLATDRSLLVGQGDGTFLVSQAYRTGMAASSIAVGDIDGDGLPDAVVGQSLGGGYSILHSARGVSVDSPDSVIIGTGAHLTVSAVGFASPTFQWRKAGQPILDGGTVTGATTSSLTIDPVSFADAGSYDVVVTDGCGSTTSGAVRVTVDFADVPASNPFHDDIVRAATAGVTAGCGGSNYCPTSPVRRDQMAVFLLKSEHGADYVPPACAGIFADVPCSNPFAPWIEQLANEGITAGCGGSNYCPGEDVNRAQVAILLTRTWQGSAFVPPPAQGYFQDVPPGSFGADYVEFLYTSGISGGCSSTPLLYCPGNDLLRQQMATLLVRTFGLED